ncbi:TPA: type III-B CRISPR module RAMP protein Cmr6 [Clostridium botulinum]|uniref:type III-B CRISPR module RAMP protein Cmr6 n=1 Tax=Clostridium botulinum TaxID=1491 RepID=UPI000D0DC865|nr:type III-B CRISPR module RAMP protein Cmr6 [Clostridium botulinum]PSM01425.1 type III-B CRISPR module RAMP protein Cmr6 [Clostridium botulinum]HDK7163642.1 type III-B CRISPR module RAMP protein Cmr6 [Clostridium botulinum]HDK7171117.1 type III-B CRISPR module RAMP protein Cmr6 [Clostridium botulinum]HDK7182170.1 type III-B CRISPR module RAMP protein Cmr6 [Clostridium botulinum]HDK7185890.1 type III-B CRISPR module RAMP protein Cmr6 [Clostridium botulinum]
MSSNIGYLYYKKYFTSEIIQSSKDVDKEYDEKNNLFTSINNNIIENSNVELLKNNKFKLIREIQDNLYEDKIYFKTTYPGLIIGTGYSHIIKRKGEFKLGLEFDYTTGLPCINGSSVKGMLRSVFYNDRDNEELRKEKENYIKEILEEVMEEENCNFDEEKFDYEELTNNIFEGKCKVKNKNGIHMSINERDIFLGATIDIEATIEEMKRTKQGKNNLLGEDYITPHGKGKDKLKNPNPIKFLKVMPNVVWCFGFDLKDFNEDISADIKKKLFKHILLDLGIGAKTNVGYGRIEFISY